MGGVVSWEGGKGGEGRGWGGGKGWESSKLARWKSWESSEVVRWEVPCCIKGWGTQVNSKFHLFVSDVDQKNDGAGWVQHDILWQQRWKESSQTLRQLLKWWE